MEHVLEALSPHVGLTEDGRKIRILDQSQLPNREVWLELSGLDEMVEAIVALRVRGAPAIGIFAGYGMYVLARQLLPRCGTAEELLGRLEELGGKLAAARPTAVNLSWAVERMLSCARRHTAGSAGELAEALARECRAIHEEDIAMCRAIAEHGLELVKDGDGVLTHCNAGPLATSRYGTALGPILLGQERGIHLKDDIWCHASKVHGSHVIIACGGAAVPDDTVTQAARLTAYELHRAGVDVTLICDNMASMVMKNGWVQACFVGCDRVAANGDTANKIGTSGVAILAKHYGVPFYVLGPTSTVDLDCPTGADIPIELRDPGEIRSMWYREPMAPEGVKCYNPAFDVTDHTLISGIVTEKGICRPPYDRSLAALFADK